MIYRCKECNKPLTNFCVTLNKNLGKQMEDCLCGECALEGQPIELTWKYNGKEYAKYSFCFLFPCFCLLAVYFFAMNLATNAADEDFFRLVALLALVVAIPTAIFACLFFSSGFKFVPIACMIGALFFLFFPDLLTKNIAYALIVILGISYIACIYYFTAIEKGWCFG